MVPLEYLFVGAALGFVIGWLIGSRRHEKKNSEMAAEVRFLNERFEAEQRQIEILRADFPKAFEAISNKQLIENSSQWGRQSADHLERLLAPLKDELKDFRTKLDSSQKETATHSALLKDQISRMGDEAANLSKALKGDTKVLGNWGENMLDQILEKSGLQLGLHYSRQQGARDSTGEQRFLDVLVHLPDQKHLIIDSKVSLKHYEEHLNTLDESLRPKLLEDHINSIRSHFRGLAAKRYQDIRGINAPDFVMMYIPIEAAFFAAVTQEPGLFREALDLDVVLITNSTLMATLRTVAAVWRLADQQKNALEIAERGGKLHDKFVGFVEDLMVVRKALNDAQAAWQAADNKLHSGSGNLVRQVGQLKALGARTTKTLPPALVEKAALSDASGTTPTPPG